MKPLKNIELKVKEDLMLLDEKELIMAIIALQHLHNETSFGLGTDILITTVSTISGIAISTAACKVIFAIFGASFATKFIIDAVDQLKINKLKSKLIEELVNRFETPQMAYLEIAEMIKSVSKEEILEYLKNIGCEYNAE
jgi:hypothetical protein